MRSRLDKGKILVADDDPYIVDCLQAILLAEGYIVETLQSGNVAHAVRTDPPDVLLLDLWLKGANGQDICKQLKSDPDTQSVPIIMVSASNDIREIAAEAQADDYLRKPFDISELLEKIAHFRKRITLHTMKQKVTYLKAFER